MVLLHLRLCRAITSSRTIIAVYVFVALILSDFPGLNRRNQTLITGSEASQGFRILEMQFRGRDKHTCQFSRDLLAMS